LLLLLTLHRQPLRSLLLFEALLLLRLLHLKPTKEIPSLLLFLYRLGCNLGYGGVHVEQIKVVDLLLLLGRLLSNLSWSCEEFLKGIVSVAVFSSGGCTEVNFTKDAILLSLCR